MSRPGLSLVAEELSDDAERGLIEQFRCGEDEAARAFVAVHRAYAGALVRYARSHGGDAVDADDVVQDVFVTLWRRRAALGEVRSLRAYLFQAVHYRVLNARRQVRHRQATDDRFGQWADTGEWWRGRDTESDPASDTELAAAIARAESQLPARCRQVYQLTREHHLTYAETAAVLGISVKTVESTMARTLRVLRAALADWRIS